jgi:hypothetical protein
MIKGDGYRFRSSYSSIGWVNHRSGARAAKPARAVRRPCGHAAVETAEISTWARADSPAALVADAGALRWAVKGVTILSPDRMALALWKCPRAICAIGADRALMPKPHFNVDGRLCFGNSADQKNTVQKNTVSVKFFTQESFGGDYG